MGLRINTDVQSIFARRQTERAQRGLVANPEPRASLLRLNRASDDAAGLAIAERFESQVRQLNAEVSGFQSGSNLIDVAESALSSQSDAVGRIRELATQAANGTLNDEQRSALNEEAQQLLQGIDETANRADFNGTNPINDGNQEIVLDGNGDVTIETTESTVDSLGLNGLDLSTQAGAQAALGQLDQAQGQISTNRAALGAQQNGLQSAIQQREIRSENLQAAESQIRDLDVGRAFLERTRNELLLQAGVTSVLRGNIQNQNALTLLGG